LTVTVDLSAAGSWAGVEVGIEDTELEEDEGTAPEDAELEEDEDTAVEGAVFEGGEWTAVEGAAFEEDEGKVSGAEEGTSEVFAGAGPTEV
jgi:hypothetical protein